MFSGRGRSDEIQHEIQLFDNIIRILHYLGLWPSSSRKGCYWFLIPRLIIVYILFDVHVIRFTHILFHWTEMPADELCVQMANLICSPLIAMMIINQMEHMQQAEAVVGTLLVMHDPHMLLDKYQRELLIKVKKFTDRITWIPWIVMSSAGCIHVIVAYSLIIERETLYGGYYPYDVKAAPYLELTVMVQTFVGNVFYPSALAVGIFYISLMMQTEVLFRILKHKLRNIRAHCVAGLRMAAILREREGEHEELSEMRDPSQVVQLGHYGTSEQVARIEINEDVDDATYEADDKLSLFGEPCSIPCGYPGHESNSRQVVQSLVDPGKVKVTGSKAAQKIRAATALDVEMQLCLKKYIKMHQELLSFCAEMKVIMSTFLFVGVLGCLGPAAVVIVYLTLVPFNNLTILFIIALSGSFCVLFALCWLADQITEQSGLVGEAAYSCDWFQASDSFKKSLRVIISSANQPFVFMAGGFVPITVKTYDSVVKNAYSYYTILRTLTKPKNHPA